MPKAYSYIRMSRPEQLRGDSLRRQREAADAWAAARGVTVDDTIQDLGVSAFRGKNRTEGALAAFLKLVEDGAVEPGSYLIVESLDRLSREAVIDALPRFIDLIKAGVVVVTLLDGQEYSREKLTKDWTPLILSLAVMARAHEESRTKATRVGEAWAKKRANAAAGTVLTSRVPAWLEVRDGAIMVMPDRVEVVRRIFRETVDGHGRRAIVRRLNQEGVPTFQGRKGWQPSTVAKILRNRSVMGEFQAFRSDDKGVRRVEGAPLAGYFPTIVSEADFLRAGLAMRSRGTAPGRRGEGITNLFPGLVRCAACGSAMQIENKGRPPKGARYFACSNARRGVGCGNTRRWRLEMVEKAILSRLWNVDLSALLNPSDHDRGALEAHEMRSALEDAELRRRRLLDLVEAGDEAAVERVKLLGVRIKELKSGLAEAEEARKLTENAPTPRAHLVTAWGLSRRLAAAQGGELADLRTKLAQTLRLAVDVITFEPDRIVVRYRTGLPQRGPLKRVPVPGQPLPAVQTVVFDDGPRSVLSAEDVAINDAIIDQEEREQERYRDFFTRVSRRLAQTPPNETQPERIGTGKTATFSAAERKPVSGEAGCAQIRPEANRLRDHNKA